MLMSLLTVKGFLTTPNASIDARYRCRHCDRVRYTPDDNAIRCCAIIKAHDGFRTNADSDNHIMNSTLSMIIDRFIKNLSISTNRIA